MYLSEGWIRTAQRGVSGTKRTLRSCFRQSVLWMVIELVTKLGGALENPQVIDPVFRKLACALFDCGASFVDSSELDQRDAQFDFSDAYLPMTLGEQFSVQSKAFADQGLGLLGLALVA